MKITKIDQAKKRESRVNVFLDDKFWIGMDKNDLLTFQLFRGMELTEQLKKEIEITSGITKMTEKAINYIMVRLRSEKEMRDYLQFKRGLSEEDSETIMNKLREKKLLDDRNYTEWYVQNRVNFGVHGENKIYAELMSKGIASSLAKEVLQLLKTDETEADLASKIQDYAKKIENQLAGSSKAKSASKHELHQKLIQKLLARGFKYSEIKKALAND